MGLFKSIGKVFSAKNAVRGATAGLTGGLSEFARSDPFGVPNAGQYLPIAAGAGLGMLAGNPMAGATLGANLYGAQQAAGAQRDANAMNMQIAQSQMGFSAQQAAQQMAFQERMSNTAYQRQSVDMAAAGLNPITGFGGGASTPSGAMGASAGARVDPVPPVSSNFISSAENLFSTYAGFKSSLATANAADAAAGKAGVETDILKKRGPEAELERKFFTYINGLLDRMSSDAKSARKTIKPTAVDRLVLPEDVLIEPGGQ